MVVKIVNLNSVHLHVQWCPIAKVNFRLMSVIFLDNKVTLRERNIKQFVLSQDSNIK